jgi:putative restriction endonuclease
MAEGDASALLGRFAALRVDRATGDPAPHKPLLLLVVLDLAERNELGAFIDLTPQLAFRFCSYFSVVAYRRGTRPDIRLPFHHLGSDGGFWVPLAADGTVSPDRRRTARARLSEQFLVLAGSVAERAALYALVGMPIPPEDQIELDARIGNDSAAEEVGRNARFRIEVVAAYDYTCALTGQRLLTIDAGSIVDAAHIHPFAASRNNDVRNGLALCKNAHWAFDEGLWSVDEQFHIMVAGRHFAEDCPDGKPLMSYQGQRLRLPRDPNASPDLQHFAWHRSNRFCGL